MELWAAEGSKSEVGIFKTEIDRFLIRKEIKDYGEIAGKWT